MQWALNRLKRAVLISTAIAASLASISLSGFAQTYTLVSGNSSVDINPTSANGVNNWRVDGVNQLGKEWFWCRDGGYEYALNTLLAQPPVFNWNGGNQLSTTYFDESNYTFSVNYTLTGGASGSGTASLLENVSIHNAAANPLTLSIFVYSDFDLAGTAGNDTVTLHKNGANRFDQAIQTDPSGVSSITTVSLGADHGEANFYDATLTKLSDWSPTTLNDATGPLGPGDTTWALEWDVVIAAGGTVNFDVLKQIAVPEPGIQSLLAMGVVIWGISRRRTRKA